MNTRQCGLGTKVIPHSPSRSGGWSVSSDTENSLKILPANRNKIILANSSPTHILFPAKKENQFSKNSFKIFVAIKLLTTLIGNEGIGFREFPINVQESFGLKCQRILPIIRTRVHGPLQWHHHCSLGNVIARDFRFL